MTGDLAAGRNWQIINVDRVISLDAITELAPCRKPSSDCTCRHYIRSRRRCRRSRWAGRPHAVDQPCLAVLCRCSHPVYQQSRGLFLVEGLRNDTFRLEQFTGFFQADNVRRIAVGAGGGDNSRRQNEFRVASLATEDLRGNRSAMSARGGHCNQKILFFRFTPRSYCSGCECSAHRSDRNRQAQRSSSRRTAGT